VLTGESLIGTEAAGEAAFADRTPSPLEASMPGVFAVGDVRAGAVKRVASAVGEGALVVTHVHGYLTALDRR
jgi:thioredoxin reductase (NADPH)